MIFKRGYLTAALLTIALYGCAHIPSRQELIKSERIPDSFRNAPVIRETAVSDNASYSDPVASFIGIFPDERLEKIAYAALERNADLLTLASKVVQARSQLRVSGSDLFPSVNVGLDYNYSDGNYKKYQTSFTQNTLNLSATVSWEADLYGKLRALKNSSRELLSYAEENLSAGRVSMLGDAAAYYFAVMKDGMQMEISAGIIANLEIITDIYAKKYSRGLIDEEDLMDARMDLANERNVMETLGRDLEENRNALMTLIGPDFQETGYAASSRPVTPRLPGVNLIPADAVFNRADVRAAVYSLNSEIYRTAGARASLYPTLSVNGNIGQIIASSNGAGDLIWQIAGSLVMPLLNRTELKENLKIQEEAARQAEYALRNAVNTALGEIETSIYRWDSSARALKNSRQYYEGAEQVRNIMSGKLKRGLAEVTDFLDYENRLLNARKMLLDAEFERISAAVAVYKAFGGSFAAPGAANGGIR